MQVVYRYKACDGAEFGTEDQCRKHEELVAEVAEAMGFLKVTPSDCGWSGYVQQSPKAVLDAKRRLFAIANRDGVLKWWIDGQKNTHQKTDEELIENCHPSWFSRMLDGWYRPLERAYTRLACIDSIGREWEQPFYAMNPGTGVDKCIA